MAFSRILSLVAGFAAAYYLIERGGLFTVSGRSPLAVLYSWPFIIASLFFFIFTVIMALTRVRQLRLSGWLIIGAVFLLVGGLWLSYLTRFSGEVVLTEGQSFYGRPDEYAIESVYKGRFAPEPMMHMKLEELMVSLTEDGQEIEGLNGRVRFSRKDSSPLEKVITDGVPRLINGIFFTLKDFGYSPRFALKSREGRVLDSSFIYMKLFPPGSEDHFRLLSPLTYYVRYYPAGRNGESESLIGLRIARNKDIVYSGDLQVSEEASFENSRISFDEIRRWTKLVIRRDWGEVMALSGIILGIIGVAGNAGRQSRQD